MERADPIGFEVVVNNRLSHFAKSILDDDTVALTVSHLFSEHAHNTEGATMLGGEPMVMYRDGKLTGGMQIGFEWQTAERQISRLFLMVDLFEFDPKTGEHTPVSSVIDASEGSDEAVEEAWTTWLDAMHGLQDQVRTPLLFHRMTGEVGVVGSFPPDSSELLTLPDAA